MEKREKVNWEVKEGSEKNAQKKIKRKFYIKT